MHDLFLIKVPETLDTKAFMHPVTIMTRSPVAATTKFLHGPGYYTWAEKCFYTVILYLFINIFSMTYFDY